VLRLIYIVALTEQVVFIHFPLDVVDHHVDLRPPQVAEVAAPKVSQAISHGLLINAASLL